MITTEEELQEAFDTVKSDLVICIKKWDSLDIDRDFYMMATISSMLSMFAFRSKSKVHFLDCLGLCITTSSHLLEQIEEMSDKLEEE